MITQSESTRLDRIDDLASQDKFARAFFTNHERQHDRSDRGKHAEFDLRLSNTRAIRRDYDVASGDEFATAAKRRAIDDMQARPSLPIHSPEAKAGAERAQRLLPIAKSLLISSLRQLVNEYGLNKSPRFETRLRLATARVNAVKRVRPDMESRDNASVFLSKPHVITFGTIFLAGLRSDEGMISVLVHELMHIADGDHDSLRSLVSAVGNRASDLTGLDVRGQRAEEITCDLIGAMASRAYVASTPGYESIARRLARSVQHNCVDIDEGDEDHLSPRNTIRALLALNPVLVRELINDREERTPGRKL